MTDFTLLEELLSRAVPQPTEKFAENLRSQAEQAYDRIYPPAYSPKHLPRSRRMLAWAGAAALVLLLGMFLTSPGRALAQKIVQFGLFVFTNEPPAAEQMLTATPETVYTPRTVRADLSGAGDMAGFPVYFPTFLPEGYAPAAQDVDRPVEVLFNSLGTVTKIEAMFEQARSGKILSFSQIPLDPAADVPLLNFGTGQTEPQFVSVGGNDGVWLQDFSWGLRLDESGNPAPVPYNLLIWEISTEDGSSFQFWLGSEEQLPLGVMLQIAESIRP